MEMQYGLLHGLEKPVSKIVMGAVGSRTQGFEICDEFMALGGTCFDTAHIYGGGECERILGEWIRDRGVRDQVVILDKGAHTPNCNPEDLTIQFMESLDRLQVDSVDIYMLHRDNLEIPVAEFIDVLHEHQAAGRMTVFGASNWSIERIEEANAYARSKGWAGFAAISNNFSLARMGEPGWPGCLASSDPESIDWFSKAQMPLMSWSSQANGFFARGNENDRSNASLVKTWYSKDNFQRLERAKELAEKLGVSPTNIALAYVLCQPFPMYGIVGTGSPGRLRDTLKALDVDLTREQMKWLNLE